MVYVLFTGVMAAVFTICMVLLSVIGLSALWAGITAGIIAVVLAIAFFLWILSMSDFG